MGISLPKDRSLDRLPSEYAPQASQMATIGPALVASGLRPHARLGYCKPCPLVGSRLAPSLGSAIVLVSLAPARPWVVRPIGAYLSQHPFPACVGTRVDLPRQTFRLPQSPRIIVPPC